MKKLGNLMLPACFSFCIQTGMRQNFLDLSTWLPGTGGTAFCSGVDAVTAGHSGCGHPGKEGLDLAAMNKLLLKKIEELTLHLIEMGRRSTKQEAINKKLMTEVEKLKALN
ncbi:MAG: hypothetical protein J7599_12440 [Niabella sp.]|nr:hypothetical protein [Niabella sp.]